MSARGRGRAGDRPTATRPSGLTFDRHLVLEQLGGWRGMVDATLPTIAFIVANALGGLRTGIWAALGAAVLVFLLRLVRRESVQQAVSGLFAVGIAVAIAAASGQARDFYVPRHPAQRGPRGGAARVGRAPPAAGRRRRRVPRAEPPGRHGRAPAPGCRGCAAGPHGAARGAAPTERDPATGRAAPDPEPERPWREDPRLLRAYGWLTVLWGGRSSLRAAGPGPTCTWAARQHATDSRHRVAAARAAGHRGRGRGDPVGRRPAAPAPLPPGPTGEDAPARQPTGPAG